MVSMVCYKDAGLFPLCDICCRTASSVIKSVSMLGTDEKLSCYILNRKEALWYSYHKYAHPLNIFPGMNSFLI